MPCHRVPLWRILRRLADISLPQVGHARVAERFSAPLLSARSKTAAIIWRLRSVAQLSESELRKRLEAEGFSHTFVWQDGPRAFYPDHTHDGLTAHIILNGEMTLTMNGESRTYRAGDRCDVPAGAVHSARWARGLPLHHWREVNSFRDLRDR